MRTDPPIRPIWLLALGLGCLQIVGCGGGGSTLAQVADGSTNDSAQEAGVKRDGSHAAEAGVDAGRDARVPEGGSDHAVPGDAAADAVPGDAGADAVPGDAAADAGDGAPVDAVVDLCVGVTCTALDPCHAIGTCDPGTGACSNPAATDGTVCNDNDVCTQVDTCQAGGCVGMSPLVCMAADQCHAAGTCNAASGCPNPNAPDGTACTAASGPGICETGMCVGLCSDGKKDGNETDVDCGGGTCPACVVGNTCAVDGDCVSTACDPVTGVCVSSECSDQHQDGNETDVDCGGGMCAKCANGLKCVADTDCASSACDGLSLLCDANQCSDHRKDGNETDVDCGGTCPSKCPTGEQCMVDADCVTQACDAVAHVCDANQCTDKQKDGSETDIDCGGGTCPTCAVGKTCTVNSDCTSSACDAISRTCVSSLCTDQQKDGDETDVDCGGGSYMGMPPCAACANGLKCVADSDCTSNACDAVTLTCVSNECADQHKDGLETDVDCGGGVCAGCGNGQQCLIDTDCSSNACDGVSFLCDNNQCIDHRQDGAETDVDCGGADLCARCVVGKKCVVNSDCQTGHTCNPGAPHLCQ
jgi:hypothetical protein